MVTGRKGAVMLTWCGNGVTLWLNRNGSRMLSKGVAFVQLVLDNTGLSAVVGIDAL